MTKNDHPGRYGLGRALGIGTAGLLGAYYLYGTKAGEKNRKKIEAWMLRAKADVLEQTSALKHMTEEEYRAIVDTVLTKYRSMKGIDMAEILALGSILKKHWNSMAKEYADREKSAPKASRAKSTTKKSGRTTKKKPGQSSGDGAEA